MRSWPSCAFHEEDDGGMVVLWLLVWMLWRSKVGLAIDTISPNTFRHVPLINTL